MIKDIQKVLSSLPDGTKRMSLAMRISVPPDGDVSAEQIHAVKELHENAERWIRWCMAILGELAQADEKKVSMAESNVLLRSQLQSLYESIQENDESVFEEVTIH